MVEWEKVTASSHTAMLPHKTVYRLEVPGGWLYKQGDYSMTFVPTPTEEEKQNG